MSANEISLIVLCIGVFGWIPIWFFFNGIVKIIRAFKGLDDYGYDKKIAISTQRMWLGRNKFIDSTKKRWT